MPLSPKDPTQLVKVCAAMHDPAPDQAALTFALHVLAQLSTMTQAEQRAILRAGDE